MRSLPDISPDRKPTEAQLNHQILFAMLVAFLKPLKNLIHVGYQLFNKGQTPMNAATSYHLKHAVTGIAPNYAIDYTQVIFSVGDLEAPGDPGITTGGTGKIVFDWAALADPKQGKPTDLATFVAYNPTVKKFVVLQNAVARTALTFTVQMPADWIGSEIHCYMSFTSANGKLASNSVYAGGIPVV